MKGKVATFGSAGPRTSKIYDLRSAEWTDAHNHTSEHAQCPISPSKPEGRLKGASIATGRAASVDLATEPDPPCARGHEPQRSRKTADLPAAMGLSKKKCKVIQCRTFSIRTGIYPTHPLPNVVRIFRKVR